MIVLRCSQCDKEIEVGQPQANQTILGPHCGQVLAKGASVKGVNQEVGDLSNERRAEQKLPLKLGAG